MRRFGLLQLGALGFISSPGTDVRMRVVVAEVCRPLVKMGRSTLRLIGVGAPKLEFGKQATTASACKTWVQGAGLKISGLHGCLEQCWQLAQDITADASARYLCLGPMQRAMVRPDT